MIKRHDFLTACRSIRRSSADSKRRLRVDDVADEVFVNEDFTIQNKILFKRN